MVSFGENVSNWPLHKIARLRPKASAVVELMFSTTRCLTFFRTLKLPECISPTSIASSADISNTYWCPRTFLASGQRGVYCNWWWLDPVQANMIEWSFDETNKQVQPTFEDWMSLATSTLVFPLTDLLLTPMISSPAASDPSREAGVLSKTWTMYKHGQRGAPPPILMPTKLVSSFLSVQLPLVMVMPLDMNKQPAVSIYQLKRVLIICHLTEYPPPIRTSPC